MVNNSRSRAFTLVELLIVVVCIGLLCAVVVPMVTKATSDSRVTTTASDMRSMGSAIESFASLYGRWPDDAGTSESNADLDAILGPGVLTQAPAIGGSYDYDNWGGTPLLSIDPTTPAKYYATSAARYAPGVVMHEYGGGDAKEVTGVLSLQSQQITDAKIISKYQVAEELYELSDDAVVLSDDASEKVDPNNPNAAVSVDVAIAYGKAIDGIVDDGDPLAGICGYTVSQWYTSYSLGPWNPGQFDPRSSDSVIVTQLKPIDKVKIAETPQDALISEK